MGAGNPGSTDCVQSSALVSLFCKHYLCIMLHSERGQPGVPEATCPQAGRWSELAPCTAWAPCRTSHNLTRLYIGHNTSALNRSPAASTAMGYITSSSPNTSRYCSSSGASSTSSVWSAVSQAAAARGGAARLAVLPRNPASESEFEKRSLQALLGGCSSLSC